MGQAKRRKAAAKAAAREKAQEAELVALMADVPLSLPIGASQIDRETTRIAFAQAGATRKYATTLMRAELEKEPNSKVNTILGIVKDLVYKTADEVADRLTTGLQVACRKGCAWCCHKNVDVSIAEAILIAVETGAPDDPRGPAFERGADEIAGLDDLARVKTGKPCPFLGAENECTIYAIRPFSCRSYFAPDAAQCQAAFEAAREGEPGFNTFHGTPLIFGFAIRTGVNGMLKDFGLQHDEVDLVSTVAAIRRNPDLIDRWAAGEHVFRRSVRNVPEGAVSVERVDRSC